jgi:hypothetical protein
MKTRKEQAETSDFMSRLNFRGKKEKMNRALVEEGWGVLVLPPAQLIPDFGQHTTAQDVETWIIQDRYMLKHHIRGVPDQAPVQVPYRDFVRIQSQLWGKVITLILDKGNVTEATRLSLSHITNPREMWTRLGILYSVGGVGDPVVAMSVENDFRNIHMTAALDVEGAMDSYISEKEAKYEEACMAGSTLSNQTYQIHLLEGAAQTMTTKDRSGMNQPHPYYALRQSLTQEIKQLGPAGAPYYHIEDQIRAAERAYHRQLKSEGKMITPSPLPSAPPVHRGQEEGEYEEKVGSLKAAPTAEREHQDQINMSYQAGRAAGQNNNRQGGGGFRGQNNNGQGGGGFRVKCHNCGKLGHYKSDCRKKGGGQHVDENKDK